MARRPAVEQGDTRARVRAEAFGLFGRYGYDGVSMLALAKGAGITKAALYWHYPGKEALYADCMRQLTALFREHVFDRMAAERDPIARLTAVFTGMAALLEDPRVREGVAGYWMAPSTADVSDARAVQARFEDASARVVAQAIQQGVDAGQLQLDIPVADMAQAVISTMEAIVLPLRRNDPARSRRLIGALAYTFFRAHALGPEPAQAVVATLAPALATSAAEYAAPAPRREAI